MLMAIDEIRLTAEHFVEGRKLHHQFGAYDFWIDPPQQPRAQQFRKRQEQAAVDRVEVHGQRPKRRRQRDVQADRAARAVGGDATKRAGFVAADRRADHHHRGGVETTAPDQVANGAVDAGTYSVIVGAQPDAARRRGAVHSAAVRSWTAGAISVSTGLTLCSATK